jgi:large subunit ribosomal protein L18
MSGKSRGQTLTARDRRKFQIRKKVEGRDERPRLSVFKSSKHMYAQVVSDDRHHTVAAASTRDKEVQQEMARLGDGADSGPKSTKSRLAARAVGIVVARRTKEAKIEAVVFDRNGYLYTGRVQALADGAREGGLNF